MPLELIELTDASTLAISGQGVAIGTEAGEGGADVRANAETLAKTTGIIIVPSGGDAAQVRRQLRELRPDDGNAVACRVILCSDLADLLLGPNASAAARTPDALRARAAKIDASCAMSAVLKQVAARAARADESPPASSTDLPTRAQLDPCSIAQCMQLPPECAAAPGMRIAILQLFTNADGLAAIGPAAEHAFGPLGQRRDGLPLYRTLNPGLGRESACACAVSRRVALARGCVDATQAARMRTITYLASTDQWRDGAPPSDLGRAYFGERFEVFDADYKPAALCDLAAGGGGGRDGFAWVVASLHDAYLAAVSMCSQCPALGGVLDGFEPKPFLLVMCAAVVRSVISDHIDVAAADLASKVARVLGADEETSEHVQWFVKLLQREACAAFFGRVQKREILPASHAQPYVLSESSVFGADVALERAVEALVGGCDCAVRRAAAESSGADVVLGASTIDSHVVVRVPEGLADGFVKNLEAKLRAVPGELLGEDAYSPLRAVCVRGASGGKLSAAMNALYTEVTKV